MKKILFIAFLLSTVTSWSQTEIFNLNGGGAFPSGWTNTNNVTANAIDGNTYYLLDAGNPSDIIETTVLDLSSYGSAEFDVTLRSFSGGTHSRLKVEISNDNGATFTQTEISQLSTTSYTAITTVSLNNLTSQMVIRLSNNETSGRGLRLRGLVLNGIGTAAADGTNFSNLINTPTTPNSTDTVTISADITDVDGINNVELQYGFTTGVYNQAPITMTLSSGTTYTGTIAAQADGTEVFYQIVATDSNAMPETSTSSEETYTVMNPIPAPNLIITEVADPGDIQRARFVEIYNNGTTDIDFAVTPVFLAKFTNGATFISDSEQLVGTLNAGSYYIIAGIEMDFNTSFGFNADAVSSAASSNGDDAFALYAGTESGASTLFDIYGVIGQDGTNQDWEFADSRAVRNSVNELPDATWQVASWTITSADVADMTPGESEPISYTYDGTTWSPITPEGNSTTSDDITVLSGTVAFTSDVDVRNLNIDGQSTLDLGSNTLNVRADITAVLSTLMASDATINLSGVLPQQIDVSEITIENLILNNANGASLNGVMNLEGALDLINGELTTNDQLTFKSKAGQSAYVAPVVEGSITGDVIIEQYYPAQRAFRFISSPVNMTGTIYDNWQQGGLNPGDLEYVVENGTHITGGTLADGFDPSGSNNPSAFLFDQINQVWTGISTANNFDTNTGGVNTGQPARILIRGDRSVSLTTLGATPTSTTLVSKGTLTMGDASVGNLSTLEGGFSFIGNPYQAQVNINTLFNDISTVDVDISEYYAWDPTIGTQGAYVTHNFSTGNSNTTSSVNEFIQPGQAFFISTTDFDANGAITPSLTFKETHKSNNSITTDTYRNANVNEFISISLFKDNELSRGKARDGVLMSFDVNATNLLDTNDAKKFTNPDENLSITTLGESLSITQRAMPTDGEIIPLKLTGLTGTNYTFEFNNEFLNSQAIFIDYYLGTEITLAPGINAIQVSFDSAVSSSVNENRFAIKFENVVLSVDDSAFTKAIKVYPNPFNGSEITVDNLLIGEPVNVNIYNTIGQLVVFYENTLTNGSETLLNLDKLKNGVYLLNIKQANIVTSSKIIKK